MDHQIKMKVDIVSFGDDADGSCTLLKIGGFNILLDCGSVHGGYSKYIGEIQASLGGSKELNAVIISHADLQHMGSLPAVFGKNALTTSQVICTLPVFKFGQMLLYDYVLNRDMEGLEKFPAPDKRNFDLDDVDLCFKNVCSVKFSQTIQLHSDTTGNVLSVVAHSSGRTIGGSTWSIRCGATEILYVVDVNLRKEIVLEGASLDTLPTSPSILLIDAGSSGSTSSLRGATAGGAQARRKKDKEDPSGLIAAVLDTVRGEGNALIPCETAGRLLEVIQLLGAYWAANKLAMYHLIFLSPMAYNVLDFAKSQLEWMGDSLSKNFYNGRPNPFDLPYLKMCTSVRELEKTYPGPKVVIATDASLTSGYSKELVLRWGGDPRCRVIFIDNSPENTLAHELRTQSPPVLATVTRPLRVELVGEELTQFRENADKLRRQFEERSLRQRREAELALLAVETDGEDSESEEENVETDMAIDNNNASVPNTKNDVNNSEPIQSFSSNVPHTNKKRKLQSSLISKFITPAFPMFESKSVNLTYDEYGASIDDITFPAPAVTANKSNKSDKKELSHIVTRKVETSKVNVAEKMPWEIEVPTKLIATTTKMQFTCGIREASLGSRADVKAIRTIVSLLSPARVVVLRGVADNTTNKLSDNCVSILNHAKSVGAEAIAPSNGQLVSFDAAVDRLRLQVPQSLIPHSRILTKRVGVSVAASTGEGITCSVSSLHGQVMELAHSDVTGMRAVRLHSTDTDTSGSTSVESELKAEHADMIDEEDEEMEIDEDIEDTQVNPGASIQDNNDFNLDVSSPIVIGKDVPSSLLSVGEVMLNTLKQMLEGKGVTVEFIVSATGSLLLCNSQVIIRKERENDFTIEGPPVGAYFEARRALYELFACV